MSTLVLEEEQAECSLCLSPTGGKTANGGALPVSVGSYNVVIGSGGFGGRI